MERLNPGENKESSNRIEYYESVAKGVLKKYGKEFGRFAKKEKRLAELGDHLLKNKLCTGYNILLDSSAMQLDSEEKLIFYSNYIRRTRHFGTLLALIEKEGLITEKDVSFGARASKFLYDDAWGIPDPQDEKVVEMRYADSLGKRVKQKVDETVETVVTVRPINDEAALGIVTKLFALTWSENPFSIQGSWSVPDIRATSALKSTLTYGRTGFSEVIVNVFSRDPARLIILKNISSFSFPWESFPIGINYKLAEYLTSFGVGP